MEPNNIPTNQDIAPDLIQSQTWNEAVDSNGDLHNYGAGISPRSGKPLQSPNFISGESGWRIDSNGNAEFNDGTFRGTFNIGGTTITINNTQDIQTNLDTISTAGGGTLWLQPGTYTLTADISIPSGVILQGVSRDGVIINCNSSYAVKILGTNVYSTGTVTINNGDTTVVGSGTTWTSAMVGRYILLDGLWYEITARTDNTHITITTYQGVNLSGSAYVLADTNFSAKIKDITITGATGSGLVIQYAMEPIINNLVIYGCGTGIEMDYVTYPKLEVTSNENGVNLNMNFVEGFFVDYSDLSYSTSGNGVTMTDTRNSTFFNSSVNDNTGDGINMTTCSKISFISFDISGNGGQGVELVSGCDDNQFTDGVIDSNTSDGIKLTATSDRNILVAISIKNNGGYGINIAASSCDDNQIVSPAFSNNTSGNISDSGTNTQVIPDTTTTLIPRAIAPHGATGSASIDTNTIMRVNLVEIPVAITVNKITINVTTVNVAGTVDLSVYSADGQSRPISVTTATISATGAVSTSVSAVKLKAGSYYLAINTNSTTDLVCSVFGISSLSFREVSSEPTLTGTITITAGTPATTFNPTSDITVGTSGIMFRLDT